MKASRIMVFLALLATLFLVDGCGCGTNEPSNREIAQGMVSSFAREAGVNPACLKAKAKNLGNGRWAVTLQATRYGETRTLKATAVMDRNGDIHYYTD